MKSLTALFSCMFLCCYAAIAEFSGSDDFNDNIMNPSNWYVNDPLLTETNGRVEFATTGSGTERGSWYWIQNTGSYTQDWAMSIDAFNSSTPSGSPSTNLITLTARNLSNPSDSFSIGLAVDGIEGPQIWGGWNDYSGSGHFVREPITFHAAELRISYDATAETLSCAYNEGGGFNVLTNFNPSSWAMGSNKSFMVGIVCNALDSEVLAGQIYADNFKAVTLPGISNHLYSITIQEQRDYETPFASDDDRHDFEFEAETDSSVTNVSILYPSGSNISISVFSIDGDSRIWEYAQSDSTSHWNQFGDGDYTVILTDSNGLTQSTIVPFMQEDGVTPIPSVTNQPSFTSPSPLHGALFLSSMPISLALTNIDPNANLFTLHRGDMIGGEEEKLGIFSDVYPLADGPLSIRTYPPLMFAEGDWEIELSSIHFVNQENSDGVQYLTSKTADVDYQISVLNPADDYDSDGLPNWWEALYFEGPTNAIATLDSDLDGHDNIRELIAGMNPTDSNSVFRITSCKALADDFLIEWPSVSGRVYSAYWTTNLTNSFQPLETGIEFPINSSTDLIHNAEDKCFYRVDVQIQ